MEREDAPEKAPENSPEDSLENEPNAGLDLAAPEASLEEFLPLNPYQSVRDLRRRASAGVSPATMDTRISGSVVAESAELRFQFFSDLALLFCAYVLPFVALGLLVVYFLSQ